MPTIEEERLRKENTGLRMQLAKLREKMAKKQNPGYWGLEVEPGHAFTHTEIIYMFSRIFDQIKNFESVTMMDVPYPDCTVKTSDGAIKRVEFEPCLSAFDHEDLSQCDYIVCWEDDLKDYDALKQRIEEHNNAGHSIEIIEIKNFWHPDLSKKSGKILTYKPEEFKRLGEYPLKILAAFIRNKKTELTLKDLREATGLQGNALGGVMSTFKQLTHKGVRPPLVKQTLKETYIIDKQYIDSIKSALKYHDLLD